MHIFYPTLLANDTAASINLYAAILYDHPCVPEPQCRLKWIFSVLQVLQNLVFLNCVVGDRENFPWTERRELNEIKSAYLLVLILKINLGYFDYIIKRQDSLWYWQRHRRHSWSHEYEPKKSSEQMLFTDRGGVPETTGSQSWTWLNNIKHNEFYYCSCEHNVL